MMELGLSVEMVASWIPGSRVEGRSITIRRIAPPDSAVEGDLCFVADKKLLPGAKDLSGVCLLVGEGWDLPESQGCTVLRVPDPMAAMIEVCMRVERILWPTAEAGIHAAAVVHPDARVSPLAKVGPCVVIEEGAEVADGAVLEAHVFVGAHACVGARSIVRPNAVIGAYSMVGANCIVGPGVVLGTPGFGYRFDGATGSHVPIPQIGRVRIEDDVEMGANCAIDRARIGETIIGRGTKIDNLVHIGHNCKIGPNCLIVAQTGISGSTIVDNNVTFGGQVGTVGHIHIGANSVYAARSGIIGDMPEGVFCAGFPVQPHTDWLRMQAAMKHLPEMSKKLKQMEKKLAQYEKK